MDCPNCNGEIRRSPNEAPNKDKFWSAWYVCTECFRLYSNEELFGERTLERMYPSYCEDFSDEDLFWEEFDYREEQFANDVIDMLHELDENGYVMLKAVFLDYYEMLLIEFKEHFTCFANNLNPNEDKSKREFVIESYSKHTYLIKEQLYEPCKSPLYWYGGKGNMKHHIIKYINIAKHTHYISVFGGSACIEFEKELSDIETYNDLNEGVTNFFKVLRDNDKTECLMELLQKTPYSLQEFKECSSKWPIEPDEIEKARMFFVATNQAINANGGWKTTKDEHSRGKARTIQKWESKIAAIIPVQERLSRMQIDNRDFRQVLKSYDTTNSLFYMDPPYVPNTRSQKKSYKYEMSRADHLELVQVLLSIKGKAILSGYDNDIYDILVENGWRKELLGDFSKASSNAKERPVAQEYVWLNFDEKGNKNVEEKHFELFCEQLTL